ncbi:MAG TPA: proton-conducting transporter membrane subunit [Anaerolineaceae bacterium]|nr:proton-conducting transporter membrane subunit [Anaerolineaceae bacterium]HPN50703.1 proton-conducting transporter membrane subunit [Anaerolineaceae bacterium]
MQNWLWMIGLPIVAAPIIYVVGRTFRPGDGTKAGINPAMWVALLSLLATGFFTYQAWTAYIADATLETSIGMVALRADGISFLMATAILVLGSMATLYSGPYLAADEGQEKFYALLTAMIGMMIGLSCARDLFNLWIWFEGMAIASFPLVAFYRRNPAGLEAGIKYLVQSAAGSILVLVAIALVYSETGSLAYDGIVAASGRSLPMLAAGALFIVGFGVKVAMVPLHTWLPDAHSQAPSPISAMLSGVVIEAGLIALIRSLGVLQSVSNNWGVILLGFGALNMLVGNLLALRQTQVKRLLAFSSLAHIGYILLGIGVAASSYYFDDLNTGFFAGSGSFFHILTHALMKGLAFLAAGCLLYSLYISRGSHEPLTKNDLAGAARRYPLEAFGLSVAVLALGGLPPLAGFMSKWQIFVGSFMSGNPWIIGLVIFAAFNSVLSLGYYAPLVNLMYRHEPGEVVLAGKPTPWLMILPVCLLALAVVVLGFWPSLVQPLTDVAGFSLLQLFGFVR